MAEYNYLPAMKRARLSTTRHLTTRQSPVKASLDFGGNRTFLCDVSFYSTGTTGEPVFARIGKWGSGPLTQDFYPLALFNTKPKQECGVWEFSKPYRIYPGERLSAAIEYVVGLQSLNRDFTVPAVQFNGVRVLDNRPILLCDNLNSRVTTTSSTRLIAEKLQCPADSPVDIYSCVGQPTTTMLNRGAEGEDYARTRLMIYGPDGRQWWDDIKWPYLFDPFGFIMDLNKPEWVLEPGESFFCEFITSFDSEVDLCINLRGHIEVVK